MQDYPWAVNKSKLERATTEVLASSQLLTEDAVKVVYIRLLGLVAEAGETPVEAAVRSSEEKKEQKKKKGKK